MKNKFMQHAVKQQADFTNLFSDKPTPLQIIRIYESELKKGKTDLTYTKSQYSIAKMQHKKFLYSFAKRNISDEAFKQFEQTVLNYVNNNPNIYKKHFFNKYSDFRSVMLNTDQAVVLDRELYAKEKTILRSKKEKDIKLAYIEYWTHQMTYVYNKKIAQPAKDMYEEHHPDKTFVTRFSDYMKIAPIEPGDSELHFDYVGIEDFDKIIDTIPKMILRSNPAIYAELSINNRHMVDIFSDADKRRLEYYKNEDILFLANAVHAMKKSKWSQSTLDLIEKYLRDGGSTREITKIIESMIDDGDFDQTWKYKEKVGENGINLEEEKFLKQFSKVEKQFRKKLKSKK